MSAVRDEVAESLGVSPVEALSFFRRAALDHVFPAAVSQTTTSFGVVCSWMIVTPSVVESICLSFWNATVPPAVVMGWRMVLWGGIRP